MISDSPYKAGEPVMSPFTGILVGLLASIMMLLIVYFLQTISAINLVELLSKIGSLLSPDSILTQPSQSIVIGLIIHLGLGTVLGLLYAISQQTAPTKGLLGVGLFFGFLTWIFGSLLIGAFFGEQLRLMIRSWVWLISCLLFGLTLSISSVLINAKRHNKKSIVALD